MKFTAVGDAIIQRRIFEKFKGYDELCPFIERGDARFFNLETTLNQAGDCPASAFSGGTYLRSDARQLADIQKFGFNMTSFNNNHAADYHYQGMLDTLTYLDKSGLVHAGVGKSLAQASAPRFLETENGRVALIAVNSSFNETMIAGEQTRYLPGRPGINPLRFEETYNITEEEFAFLQDLAERTEMNAARSISIKEGYTLPENANELNFCNCKFIKSNTTRKTQTLSQKDLTRVAKAIEEAAFQADEVIVSVHSHQLSGTSKESPAEFLVDFAHFCIDSGATAIIGHGPHLLRPIEVYKECPIFYSLGDFILQLYNIEYAPVEFYEKYGMTPDATVYELLSKRSKNFTIGLMSDIKMFESVIPYWERENGRLKKIELLPIKLSMDGNQSEIGLPRKATDTAFMQRLAEISAPFGVTIHKNDDGTFYCQW